MCDDGMLLATGEDKMLTPSYRAVTLVLSALRNHSSHVGVQEMGLGALRRLAMHGSWGVVGGCEHTFSCWCIVQSHS